VAVPFWPGDTTIGCGEMLRTECAGVSSIAEGGAGIWSPSFAGGGGGGGGASCELLRAMAKRIIVTNTSPEIRARVFLGIC
jgi:hypothetical protein